jgi:hypothetical protein
MRRQIDEIKREVAFLGTEDASKQDPRLLVDRLERVLERVSAQGAVTLPHTNTFMMALLNNLANCHFFVATRCNGGKQHLRKFIKIKSQVVQAYEDRDEPVEFTYVRTIWRMLQGGQQGGFSSQKQRNLFEQKFRAACSMLFGQERPPHAIVSDINSS